MGILSGLFKSRDKPTNRANGSSYSFLMGVQRVNERSDMQMTAVYSCVRILSEAVASLPLHVYLRTDTGTEKAIDHPLYKVIHDEPNPEMTCFVFRETMMTHLLLCGNAYAQIIRNGKGEVLGLYPLMPDRMKVDRDDKGRIYYEYLVSDVDSNLGKQGTVKLNQSDVLHIPGLGFDGLVGYSPIAMAKNAIGMAIATEEYGASFFANGATSSGILEYPGTVKDPQEMRDSWSKGFSGSNSHKVAILEEGMKYTPISISPNEAQFLETRKFQINEIARIFRVPPHMVGDLEKSSFSNIEQQSLEFVKYTLDPWVARCEQSIVRRLLTDDEKKKYYVKFNVDGLLRGDYQSRMNGYVIGRQNGWMSANDIRTLENLDPIPSEEGEDLYLVNGNMLPFKNAGAFTSPYLFERRFKMNFKEMKNTLNEMINNNYEDFVKALISVEKGINNHEALNNLYEQFMENDGMNLLHEEFDYMIDELVNKGVIKENDKEIELSEYVGNVVSDVKVEELEGKNGKFKVANFSIVVNDESGDSKFINISAYGEKSKFVEDMKKGDFVKITGEERYSMDEKGSEYLNVKAVYSKILKAKTQEKQADNKKELTLDAIAKFKDKISNEHKSEDKKDKGVEL